MMSEEFHIEGKITGGTHWVSWPFFTSFAAAEETMKQWETEQSQDWMKVVPCTDRCVHTSRGAKPGNKKPAPSLARVGEGVA